MFEQNTNNQRNCDPQVLRDLKRAVPSEIDCSLLRTGDGLRVRWRSCGQRTAGIQAVGCFIFASVAVMIVAMILHAALPESARLYVTGLTALTLVYVLVIVLHTVFADLWGWRIVTIADGECRVDRQILGWRRGRATRLSSMADLSLAHLQVGQAGGIEPGWLVGWNWQETGTQGVSGETMHCPSEAVAVWFMHVLHDGFGVPIAATAPDETDV